MTEFIRILFKENLSNNDMLAIINKNRIKTPIDRSIDRSTDRSIDR